MALTRKFLKDLGVESDAIDSIVEEHRKTVDKCVEMWYIVCRRVTKFGFLMILSIFCVGFQQRSSF